MDQIDFAELLKKLDSRRIQGSPKTQADVNSALKYERDYWLLRWLVITGSRTSEAANLTVGKATARDRQILGEFLEGKAANQHVFVRTRHGVGKPLTRRGIWASVRAAGNLIGVPDLSVRRIRQAVHGRRGDVKSLIGPIEPRRSVLLRKIRELLKELEELDHATVAELADAQH